MATFKDIPLDIIQEVLTTARNTGDWHTPTVHDISIKSQNERSVYGTYLSDLHSQYRDKLFWFNINANSVHIWERDPENFVKVKDRKIYNFQKLLNLIAPYSDASKAK